MSNRGDTDATRTPSTEDKNLSDLVHTSESIGAWPCLLVHLSSHVQCILDMALDTCWRSARVVASILDPFQRVPSFAVVEARQETEMESFDDEHLLL